MALMQVSERFIQTKALAVDFWPAWFIGDDHIHDMGYKWIQWIGRHMSSNTETSIYPAEIKRGYLNLDVYLVCGFLTSFYGLFEGTPLYNA